MKLSARILRYLKKENRPVHEREIYNIARKNGYSGYTIKDGLRALVENYPEVGTWYQSKDIVGENTARPQGTYYQAHKATGEQLAQYRRALQWFENL